MHIKEIFLLVRPYSLIDIALVGLLLNTLIVGKLILNLDLVINILVALCWWVALNLLSESQKNKNVPIYSSLIFFAILIYMITIKNPCGLLFLAISLLALVLYVYKRKKFVLGVISPISRGLLHLSLIVIILTINNAFSLEFLSQNIGIIFVLVLIIISRNLMADIRDIEVDRFSLPKVIGKSLSFFLIELSLLVSIFIIKDILTVIPFIFLFFIILFYRDAYLLHRIYVIITTFFSMNYIFLLLNINLIYNAFLLTAVLLNFTYDNVPRTLYRKMKCLEL